MKTVLGNMLWKIEFLLLILYSLSAYHKATLYLSTCFVVLEYTIHIMQPLSNRFQIQFFYQPCTVQIV